jgi:death on curing protein
MNIFEDYENLFRSLSQTEPVEWLNIEEVEVTHDYLIEEYGGQSGVRDFNQLQNTCSRSPYRDKHNDSGERSLYDAAASYMWEIARYHPFNDGNKRTAVASALIFLQNNKVSTKFDDVLLEQLVKKCANSESLDYYDGLPAGHSFSREQAMEEFLKCRA